MKVYLGLFEMNGKVCYKIGHTKYFYPIKRFLAAEHARNPNLHISEIKQNLKKYLDPQYQIFDNIQILDDIKVEHENAITARLVVQAVEECLKAYLPKNFRLEEHFNMPSNTFDGLSGITEMFILEEQQTTEDIKDIFSRVKQRIERLLK